MSLKSKFPKPVTALKGMADYAWFEYTGKNGLDVMNDKGRTLSLAKGEKFGIAVTRDGTRNRLVTEKGGLTKIFTCDADVADHLADNCKAATQFD